MFLLYLVFRDEIENLLYNISDFEKGARNKTINSRGRARILDANSRETFRDREFSPMSVAMIFKLAMNRVRAFMYNLGDIKVVELVILLSTLLVCSAASVLTCFNEQYFELLKADEQVVWFFS